MKAGNRKGTKVVGFTLFAMLFALCLPAGAQQPKKVFRIGYLSNTNPARESADSEAISRRLHELGYLEGQNISIDYRYGEGNRDRGHKLAAELVALNCDVIVVAGGYSWVRAVMDATKTIPIVMAGGGRDPVAGGVIKSLAHPGGNVTGIANFSENLSRKRLELFKEAVPNLARIAVLYDSGNSGDRRLMKEEFPVIARALKFTLQPWEVRTADDFEKVFATADKERPDGLDVLGGGGLMTANVKRIVNFARTSRLPSMYNSREYVDGGGLMSYGTDVAEQHRLVAWYVDRILKGAKPAGLPVQQPMKFEFVINLQTAKQLGVAIPPDVLARATKIIR